MLSGKAANVANLSHKLWANGFSYAEHSHDNGVFGQLENQTVHLRRKGFHHAGDAQKLRRGLLYHQLGDLGFGNQSNYFLSFPVNLLRFLSAEIVAMPLAPLVVALGKGIWADGAYTIYMLEGHHKVQPLLTLVLSCGTSEEAAGVEK